MINRASANMGSYVYRLLEKDHIVQSYFIPIAIGMKARDLPAGRLVNEV